MQNMTPLFSNDSAHPLIQKILSNPRYRKMYIAHMRTISEEFFANGFYLDRAQYLRNIIDAAVQSDSNGFFNYTQFQNSLTTNTAGGGGGPGGMSVPGIQVLMDARNSYLQGTTEFTQAEPVITNVHPLAGAVTFGTGAEIQATVQNATEVFLGFRTYHSGRFHRISMFDDGQHNDGSAGDNIYGAAFTVDGTQPEFYVYAENLNAGKFSPARAEHEFYTVTLASQPLTSGTVVINEVLTDNSIQEDEYGESNDWVELFNASNTVIDLSGAHLSDTISDPFRWTFREGTLIGPGEYLIVWADDDEEQWFHHTNFNLSSEGETLTLSDAAGTLIDQVIYPLQTTDISYGRYPNGSGPWVYMATTQEAMNTAPLTIHAPDGNAEGLAVWPNPTSSVINFLSKHMTVRAIIIHDIAGQLLLQEVFSGAQGSFDIHTFPSGIYILSIELMDGTKASLRVVKE
jgi:hypothetical protein